ALLVSPTSISSTFPVAVCVTVARLARGYSSTVINPSSQAMTPRFGILARKDSDTTASSSSLFLSKIPDLPESRPLFYIYEKSDYFLAKLIRHSSLCLLDLSFS
ncbi:hypothetical protein PSM09_18180, partial [Clostridioides difficile]|nr:hypothetical protein [Clostridioides difficile]